MNQINNQLPTSTSSVTLNSFDSSLGDVNTSFETSPNVDTTPNVDMTPNVDTTPNFDTPTESSFIIDSTIDVSDLPTPPRTSSTSYLGNPLLYIDTKEFFLGIQDKGQANIDPRTNQLFVRKPKKTHLDKSTGKLFKGIYKTSLALYNNYKNHTDIFV